MSAADSRADKKDDSKKLRSPNYPAMGLDLCLKWARKIYDSENRSPTSTTVIAKHCGYGAGPKGLSGSARTALAAMKKFGVLTEVGDNLRVSDDVVHYFLAPDEAIKLEMLRKLAFKPSLIREIVGAFPEGLPSDDTLKYQLVTQRHFLEDGATSFIKTLRETVEFAKLDAAAVASAAAVEPPMNFALVPPVLSKPPANQLPISTANPLAFRVELSDGTWVSVEPSGPLNASTFEELMDYLNVYKKVLSKRSVVAPVADD